MSESLPPEIDLLVNLKALHAKVDTHAKKTVETSPDRFACRAGCDGCCQTERHVMDVEFDLLKTHFEMRGTRPEPSSPEGPCALLVDGRCAAYDARPLICSSHGLPLIMEGLRDVCPLNFVGVDLGSLPDEAVFSVDTATAILVVVNALYCQLTGGDPDRRRPVSDLLQLTGETAP